MSLLRTSDIGLPHSPSAPGARSLASRLLSALPSTLGISAAALLLGGATSYGQLLLLPSLAPLANAATPWVVFSFVAVWLAQGSLIRSVLLAPLALVLINSGYGVVSAVRGHPYDPLDWNLVGLVVGPLLGLAAWGAGSRRPALVALGSGLVAAALIGESLHALLTIGYPEQRPLWIAIDALTLVWIGLLAARRVRSAGWIAVQLLLVGVVASGSFLVYGGRAIA